MGRIFGIVSIFAICMVMLGGAGVFWLSLSDLEQAKRESATGLAKGLAYSVSSQVLLLEKTVEQIATDIEVVTAVSSGSPVLMDSAAKKLQKFLPSSLKLRILLPDVKDIDESSVPHMGYADLAMVQKTFQGKQMPIIQGQGENRHFAITAAITKDEQVIGVLLASLEYDFVNAILAKSPIGESFVEIKQGKIALGKGGDSTTKSGAAETLKIKGTPWQLDYWPASAHNLSSLSMIIGVLAGASLLACCAFLFCYYQITVLLKKDQNSILQAVKDLMTGKGLGSYPVNLGEMKVIISTLVQFKRILDNKEESDGNNEAAEKEDDEFDLNDGDMFNLDDLDIDGDASPSLEKKN